MAPTSSVIVCAVPRSGSSLLAALLRSSGLVGWPAEWFWREDVERNSREWGVETFDEYLPRALAAGTSPNGVFGLKLMWAQLGELVFSLRRLSRAFDEDDLAVLARFFPNPRFAWIRREDVVAQAVSWARAVQTGQWISGQPAVAAPQFDRAQIAALYDAARIYDGAWRRWFAAHGVAPVEVTYERLEAEPAAVTRDVLRTLGLEPPADCPFSLPEWLTKQADELSADWAARYRAGSRA